MTARPTSPMSAWDEELEVFFLATSESPGCWESGGRFAEAGLMVAQPEVGCIIKLMRMTVR